MILWDIETRRRCHGRDKAPLSHLRNRRRFLRYCLEPRRHCPFPAADENCGATERLLLRRLRDAEPGAPTPQVLETVAAVKRYFQGEETDFSDVELDLAGQDAFFRGIYAAARRVGWGRTTTYGALAKELGAGPEAARDVGQAMAKNPIA